MLLTQAQYRRVLEACRPGNLVRVGPEPGVHEKQYGPGWNPNMRYFSGGSHVVRKAHIIDQPVTADGQILHEVWIRLLDQVHGLEYDFCLDWLDDPKLMAAIDGPPIEVRKVSTTKAQVVSRRVEPEEVGLGLAAGGAMALITGLTALRNKFGKKKEVEIVPVIPPVEEKQVLEAVPVVVGKPIMEAT